MRSLPPELLPRRPRALLSALFLAFACAAAGCESSDACVPGGGQFGARCCAASDCQGGLACHDEQCTKACTGAADCNGFQPDGGSPGCEGDGFCRTPPPPSGGDASGNHGW